MVLDNELVFDMDTPVSASFNSKKVIDLGANGSVYEPMDLQVQLSTGCTSGTINSVKVQSAKDAKFSSPVDEVEFHVPTSLKQNVPCVLAQFKCPITPQNRYVRLAYAGTSPSGGKVTAFITRFTPVAF